MTNQNRWRTSEVDHSLQVGQRVVPTVVAGWCYIGPAMAPKVPREAPNRSVEGGDRGAPYLAGVPRSGREHHRGAGAAGLMVEMG